MTVVGETTIISAKANSVGWSEEAKVLIEYVFSAALASEPGNPAGFRQATESAEVERKKSTVEEIKKAIAKRLSIKAVSYTHLTLPTTTLCRSRWSPYH